MPEARSVRVATVLTAVALALVPAAHAAPPVRGDEDLIKMVEPGVRDVFLGTTTFAFEVAATDPPIDRIDIYVNGRLVGAARPDAWELAWPVPDALEVTDIDAIAFSGDRVRDRLHAEPRSPVLNVVEEVRLVQLYPVVTDSMGDHVEGLAMENFAVSENGRPVDVRYFSAEPATLSIVLLLDGSESMLEFLPEIQVAALKFLESLAPEDRVEVYSFNQRATKVVGFDASRDDAMAAVLDLDASGGTALYDAVAQVIEDLRPVRGRKAMFVFSDGKDRQSLTSTASALDLARAEDVMIYSVATGGDETNVAERQDLRRLADETGGKYLVVHSPVKIGEALESTLVDLRAQYVLGYSPPPGPDGVREISVRVVGYKEFVKRMRDLGRSIPSVAPTVRHRTMYFYENHDGE